MKFLVRGVIALVGLFGLALIALFVIVQLRWDRTFDIAVPDIQASTDPEVIERGAYLAYGPMHCAYCHLPPESHEALARGERPPLTGGYRWQIPPATLVSPNLTPDPETGIGSWSDGELARVLRNNLRRDGRAVFPMKEFENIADQDLLALVSFLRAQPPVRAEHPATELTALGKAVFALAIEPRQPSGVPPSTSPPEEPTVERGRYVSENLGMCKGCHTARDMKTGAYVGEAYAGGMEMEVDDRPGWVMVTPNLTPDPETGVMAEWTEEVFVGRFQAGGGPEGSHMPWTAYATMSETDLRALWRFYESLAPVKNDTGDVLRQVE